MYIFKFAKSTHPTLDSIKLYDYIDLWKFLAYIYANAPPTIVIKAEIESLRLWQSKEKKFFEID